MAGKYVYDEKNVKFRRATRTVGGAAKTFLKYAIASVTLALLYYVVFALVTNTDTERRLIEENRVYANAYARMQENERMLKGTIEGLQAKDNDIYEEIFHTEAPLANPTAPLSLSESVDTIPDRYLVEYASGKAAGLMAAAASVNEAYAEIVRTVTDSGFVLPPLGVPVAGLSYSQIGASIGMKINPFYKVAIQHNGLDMIVPQGSDVLATASGTVASITRNRKGQGNVIEIDHGNGWVTRYAHLGGIFVSTGQRVEKGRRIGTVGMSGNSFAPHLHYEILFGGEWRDPVAFLLDGVDKDEYANMAYMAANTEQSMD